MKESVLLRPYFAYNTHKYGTIVFNLELPTYIRDKSSFRYSYQIRKVISSKPEQKKKKMDWIPKTKSCRDSKQAEKVPLPSLF